MIVPIRTDWTLDETVMPEDMNDIGKELNRLKEEDKKLEDKKFDRTGGTVNGPVNATNLQVGGNNVYHTNRKPTPADIGASPVSHSHDDRYFTEAEINVSMSKKVDKVEGKDLSTNDFTNEHLNKLNGIAPSANKYILPAATASALGGVKSGTDITVDALGNVSVNDNSHNHLSTNITPVKLTNENLNNISSPGQYYAAGSNTVANKPSGVDNFGLIVIQSAGGFTTQILHDSSRNEMYFRRISTSGILPWVRLAISGEAQPASDVYSWAKASEKPVYNWNEIESKPATFAPSSHRHPATDITQDASRRMVSDTQITNWNNKASTAVATQNSNGLMSAADKNKLDGVAIGANAYVHPNAHSATMITQDSTHRFVTNEEKAQWNDGTTIDLINVASTGDAEVGGTRQVRRIGNMCFFNCSIYRINSQYPNFPVEWWTMARLPVGYRPVYPCWGVMQNQDTLTTYDNTHGVFKIETDGRVTFVSFEKPKSMMGCIAYVCE